MCRACDQGGRRCPKTERTKTNERAAAKRYYLRTKARTIIAALGVACVHSFLLSQGFLLSHPFLLSRDFLLRSATASSGESEQAGLLPIGPLPARCSLVHQKHVSVPSVSSSDMSFRVNTEAVVLQESCSRSAIEIVSAS